MIKPSDLPSIDSIVVPPYRPVISQTEIDHINDLVIGIRHKARQILNDAIEIGDWFTKVREKFGHSGEWGKWLKEAFPKISLAMVWRYQKIAANGEFLATFLKDQSFSVNELVSIISQQKKMDKPRVRAVVVREDAPPEVILEAKLKNYVIELWRLRYLQTEIEGLIEAMELKPEQVLKVLRYVCREHHEVEEEILHTFNPGLKIVSKGA